MTKVFMNGVQIPKEELRNYVATFDQTGKKLLRLEKRKEGKEEKSA